MIVYRIEGKEDGLGPYRGHNPWFHLNGLDYLTAWKDGYDRAYDRTYYLAWWGTFDEMTHHPINF